MPSKVERSGGSYPVQFFPDGTGTLIQFSGCAGAILIVTDGGGTIELWAKATPESDPAPIYDSEMRPCTMAVDVGNAYEFPHGVFAASYICVRGADVVGMLSVKG